MKILIKEKPSWADSQTYRKQINAIAGKWIDVETDYLFNDQYNTGATPEMLKVDPKSTGLRIYDRDIEEVKDDARIGKAKCIYCGSIIQADTICNKREECKCYLPKPFTATNTYFIKYPAGYHNRDIGNRWFGAYYLEYDKSEQSFQLRSRKKMIIFKYDKGTFWIRHSSSYINERLLIGKRPLELLTAYLKANV